MRTILSTELPPLEKAIGLFITIGGSVIMIGAPLVYAKHLDYGFYFIGLPLMLIFCAFLITRVFKYKNVYFDTHHVYVETRGKELAIPLANISCVTQIISHCWIRYTENGEAKSIYLILRTSPIFGGGLDGTVSEFRQVISRAKQSVS